MRRSKLEKNKEAEERAEQRSKRSHKDQLAVLDSRLGKGVGATKERARLNALIENPSKSSESEEKPKKKRSKKLVTESPDHQQ